jgi:hypothetical protein
VTAQLLVRAADIPGLWDAILVDGPANTGQWSDLTSGQLRQIIRDHPEAEVEMIRVLA